MQDEISYYKSCGFLLLVSILFTAAEPAWAAVSCKEIFNTGTAVIGFSIPDTRLVRHATSQINRLLGPLNVPNISINKSARYIEDYSFNGLENRLNFNLGPKPLRISSLTLFAHEYGHAIFGANFIVKLRGETYHLPDIARTYDGIRAKVKEDPEYRKLKEEWQKIRFSSEQDKIKELNVQMNAISRRITASIDTGLEFEMHGLQFMVMPYNELFADLTAAMYTGNGAAVADSMQIAKQAPFQVRNESGTVLKTYREKNAIIFRPRDFTVDIPIEEFMPDGGRTVFYTLLDPVRSQIWKQYVSKTAPENYGLILTAFIRAAEKHLNVRQLRGETSADIDQIDASAFNREFIEYFKEAFEKLNRGLK